MKYVEKSPEPLGLEQQKENPWVTNNTGGGGCCAVM
jgi:hypothetical protein